MYKGIAANRIVRLNVDGSLDASLFPGLVLNGAVNVIKVVSTGLLWWRDFKKIQWYRCQ
jgi:hypothetical protein